MTHTPALKRSLAEMPCDPVYIRLSCHLETSLGNLDREDTLEKWQVVADLGEDGFGLDDIPPCEQCTGRWRKLERAGEYIDDEECLHRLHVGELEFVKVRWGGSNPFWAMEEESQNLYEIAETVFNDEHNGFTPQFEDIAEFGGDDLLILDKAELAPAWRGFGLAPMIAADALLRLSAGAGAVMVHPAPLTHEQTSTEDWNRGQARLRELWGELGFVPYANTPYMIYATCWADPETKQYALRKASRELSTNWRAARTDP